MIDWLACTFVKSVSWLFCRLPPSVAVWCGEQAGGLAYWLQPKRTRIGIANLRAAFDGQLTVVQTRRTIRACFKHLGAGLLEMLRLPVIDAAYIDRYITVEGQRHFDEAVGSGKPVIFLAGHYGNWELSSIVAALKGHPIIALARAQEKLPKLYKLLVSYRESKGCRIVHKGGAMKRLISALGEGKLVGIVGDQASRQGIFVDFFGRPALFATGPLKLAYTKRALILPVFLHRVRGPFHRLILEAPIVLPRERGRQEAVRHGIEQFANTLARHILDDPRQWLWMHKRWKHTPARRVLILSDGKAGHLKQSTAVVESMRETNPAITSQVVEVRYRHRLARGLALLWSWWMPARFGAAACLWLTLTRETTAVLLKRYADLIVSCGASTVPATLLWASENGAKSVVLMNPTPVPLNRFDLVIAPRHDGLPKRPNVVQTLGAVSRMEKTQLLEARGRLHAHPKFRPEASPARQAAVISVFIGGDTPHYDLNAAFAEALVAQVLHACEAVDGVCLVTTSRRTSPAVERALAQRLGRHLRCRLLLFASHDSIDGTMEGMLGWADVAVVTGESISMVSEACASGRPVVVVEPPLRGAPPAKLTKHQQFLASLVAEGHVRQHPVPEVSHAIQRTLKERRAAKRLDDFAAIRNAVARLL